MCFSRQYVRRGGFFSLNGALKSRFVAMSQKQEPDWTGTKFKIPLMNCVIKYSKDFGVKTMLNP